MRSFSSLPAEQWPIALFDTALQARGLLESAWSAETAFQGIELQPHDMASRGQCGVSSLWLARHLWNQGVDAYFTEGKIHLDELQEDFVWVEVRRPGLLSLVADLASDQFQTPNRTAVHIGTYNCGPGTIGCYEPLTHFAPYEIPRRKLLARFAILEKNIGKRR